MSAQSVRLNTVASNLANADSVSGDPNTVYRARHPVFQAIMGGTDPTTARVNVSGIAQSQAAPETRYDPGNPLADAQGLVRAPDMDLGDQMTQLMVAQRAYEANLAVIDRARDAYLQAIQIGK